MEENYIAGVKTFDFELPKETFYNSTLNPENSGFCSQDCLGNGVMDISKCYGGILSLNELDKFLKISSLIDYQGAPSYISMPHFLNAEEKFVNSLTGLKPNASLHKFIIHFEPVRIK